MHNNDINYNALVEKSLKNVVIQALQIAEEEGLSNDNHFYITFLTTHPQTRISAQLMSQHPEEMTIVLQHQFQNLMVTENYFSVELSFGGILQSLHIPFDAVTYFADPSAKFALSFNTEDDDEHIIEVAKENSTPAQVISFDSFKKS